MQTLSKTSHIRAKATPTLELSLLSKLSKVIKLKLGRGTITGGNPERCQETEGNLHVEVSFDNPHIRMETSAEY